MNGFRRQGRREWCKVWEDEPRGVGQGGEPWGGGRGRCFGGGCRVEAEGRSQRPATGWGLAGRIDAIERRLKALEEHRERSLPQER